MSYRCITFLACVSQLCLVMDVVAGISDFVPPIGLEDTDLYDAGDNAMEPSSVTQHFFDLVRKYIVEKNIKNRILYEGEKLPGLNQALLELIFDTETSQPHDSITQKRNDRRVRSCYRKFHNNNLRKRCLMKAI